MSDFFKNAFAAFGKFLTTQRRLSSFTCGDCERWERCGLPPDEKCAYRVEQMARGDWVDRRRAARLESTLPVGGA
jgi:hypothetical protein